MGQAHPEGKRPGSLSLRTKISGVVAFCLVAGSGALAAPAFRAQQADASFDPAAKVAADEQVSFGKPIDPLGPIHWAGGRGNTDVISNDDLMSVHRGEGEGLSPSGTVWFDVDVARLSETSDRTDQYVVFTEAWWHTNHNRGDSPGDAKSVLRITSSVEGLPSGTESSGTLALKDEDSCVAHMLGGSATIKAVEVSYERTWEVCDEAEVKLDGYGRNFAQWSTSDVMKTPKWAMYYTQVVPKGEVPIFTAELFVPRAEVVVGKTGWGWEGLRPVNPEVLQAALTTADGGAVLAHPSDTDPTEWRAPYPTEPGPRPAGLSYDSKSGGTPVIPPVDEPEPPAPRVDEPEPPAPRVDEPEPPAPRVDEPEPPAPRVDEPEPPAPPVDKSPALIDPEVRPLREGGDCSGPVVHKREIEADGKVAATVTIHYNAATGNNCALLTKGPKMFYGQETYLALQLRNEVTGKTSTDWNYYAREAGPVWVAAEKQCISYTVSMVNPARTRWVFRDVTESDIACR